MKNIIKLDDYDIMNAKGTIDYGVVFIGFLHGDYDIEFIISQISDLNLKFVESSVSRRNVCKLFWRNRDVLVPRPCSNNWIW